jgi:hypothetical protein
MGSTDDFECVGRPLYAPFSSAVQTFFKSRVCSQAKVTITLTDSAGVEKSFTFTNTHPSLTNTNNKRPAEALVLSTYAFSSTDNPVYFKAFYDFLTSTNEETARKHQALKEKEELEAQEKKLLADHMEVQEKRAMQTARETVRSCVSGLSQGSARSDASTEPHAGGGSGRKRRRVEQDTADSGEGLVSGMLSKAITLANPMAWLSADMRKRGRAVAEDDE